MTDDMRDYAEEAFNQHVLDTGDGEVTRTRIMYPRDLQPGDVVALTTHEGTLHTYTVREVVHGMRYDGDTRDRVVVAYNEHAGMNAFHADLPLHVAHAGFNAWRTNRGDV